MNKLTKRTLIAAAALAVAGLAVYVPVLASPPADKGVKVEKPFTTVGEIVGTLNGVQPGSSPITVELLRVGDQEMTSIGTTTTKPNGDFEFGGLQPGNYLVSPVLETLPEGYGLPTRHALIGVDTDTLRVELPVARIQRLELTAPDSVKDTDPLFIETQAYDAQGNHLFAPSTIDLPAGLTETQKTPNGRGLRLGNGNADLVIKAHNGNVSTQATIHVHP